MPRNQSSLRAPTPTELEGFNFIEAIFGVTPEISVFDEDGEIGLEVAMEIPLDTSDKELMVKCRSNCRRTAMVLVVA